MKAITCMVKRNIEVLENLGIKVKEIGALGGGSRSRLWKQMKADLTDRPVMTTENKEAACLGAAILAGTTLDLYRSVDGACEKMVSARDRFYQNLASFQVYETTYQRYVQLCNELCDFFTTAESY
jgi:xylulokinase